MPPRSPKTTAPTSSRTRTRRKPSPPRTLRRAIMSLSVLLLLLALAVPNTTLRSLRSLALLARAQGGDPPANSQIIRPIDTAVLPTVPAPTNTSYTDLFIPPGLTLADLSAKPFHVYDPEFYAILGANPTLTRIAYSPVDPLFHEAVVWYPPTDEVFFAQNAGAPDAGTGANKSAIVQKISLAQAAEAQAQANGAQNATGIVDVVTIASDIINPNGATNYRGEIVFAAEGQESKPSQVIRLNPNPPYNTTALVNNFFGRTFNSLNDLAVHPITRDLHFTDVTYGWLQYFRPSPNLPNQIYRYCEATGLLQVVADQFDKPNGLTFSPDGKYAYIADTGVAQGTRFPADPTRPATIYRMKVNSDGFWSDKSVFAYISPGNPDGIHCDSNGNVYAGVGDGVHVFNPSGKLIGKIFLGGTSANFQFAGNRMVLCEETSLWYATLAATGADITGL